MKQIENNKESQRERITKEDLEKKVELEVKTREHRRNKKGGKLRRQRCQIKLIKKQRQQDLIKSVKEKPNESIRDQEAGYLKKEIYIVQLD